VLWDTNSSEGLNSRVVSLLEEAHLVRIEQRRGPFWVELTHDRLIEPIRTNNAIWREEHLQVFQHRGCSVEAPGPP